MKPNSILSVVVLLMVLGLSCVVGAASLYEKDFTTASEADEWVKYSGLQPEIKGGAFVLVGSPNPVIVSDTFLDLVSLSDDFVLTMTARLEANSGWGFVLTFRMNMWENYGSTGYQLAVKPNELVLGKQGPGGFKTISSQSNPVDFSELHTYTVRAEGNIIQIWVDDVLCFDYTDIGSEYPEMYTEGHFALKANRSTLIVQNMGIDSL